MKHPIIVLSIAVIASSCDLNIGSPIGNAAKMAAGVESEYTASVSGTPGIKFSGSYMIMKGDGSNIQKSVDGTVPAEYRLRGSLVSVSFQKQGKKGELILDIQRNGQSISHADTTADFGVVSAATQ